MTAVGAARKVVEVAVGVLVRPDGAVLLADRPEGKPYAGYWEFPGGKIEPGESVEEALARELHEELGVDIEHAFPWVVFEYDYPHAYVRLHFRRVFSWRGEPHSREGQQMGFHLPTRSVPAPLLPAAVPALRWLRLPPVCVISCIDALGPTAFLTVLERALANGLRLLVVREPALDDGSLAKVVPRIIERARRSSALVLASSRHAETIWRLADGVHLTARDLLHASRRPSLPWVSASVHNRDELVRACELGCDFALLGPVLPTESHPGQSPLGWDGFARVSADTSIPLYAIGGLQPEHLAVARRAGAHGVAMLRAAWRI